MNQQLFHSLCTDISVLLSHPQNDYFLTLDRVLSATPIKKCTKPLQVYREAIETLSITELQESYSRTFDLNPLCSPALSVHLFGVESFKRSHLMAGLLDMYRKSGFDVPGESADHMSTVLRYVSVATPEDRNEVASYILLPAINKMSEFLESKSNSFAHLLSAAAALVMAETGKEATYA